MQRDNFNHLSVTMETTKEMFRFYVYTEKQRGCTPKAIYKNLSTFEEMFYCAVDVAEAALQCLKDIPENEYHEQLNKLQRHCQREGGNYVTD